MSVESFDPSSQVVTVSPAAVAHFRRQLSSAQGKSVRLSVKKSGCTGFMYAIDLVEQASASDLHYQLDEQVELLVDSNSLEVLSGTQIDLVREGVNQQIKFINPNVKDECGCGESFSVN
ncbi:HesB/IscA family protein [Halopseudomonas sabulinigri]|uniref:Fe-S cluster assembly protein SufA/iron-sulfur cluster assembly protein n=1 Tax=Halopseudomonas sabulinigri TaxID=472181 RepID=A0A1H1M6P2_9GAMM|nr:iron-sulfur cluster assembly accessory protein [Halopseudomonas sabulinigri]SDR82448.1 Fe-S cluster assembly protein SufA/iron-sulfur cluster assembly protein [Halopseudomonas sabulinigri]